MKTLRSLPPTTLANIIAHLMEQDGVDEIRVPLDALNDTERRVAPEVTWERIGDREFLLISGVDVDSDTTDVLPNA